MPDDDVEMIGIGRFEWERLVRRVIMPGPQKLLAFTLATYSDPDGSRVRPGNDILSAVTGQSERTVKRGLAALKKLGLLTVARRGGGRNGVGKTTEYQLSVPSDLLERVDMLPPGERPESEATRTAPQNGHSDVDNSAGTVDKQPVDNSSEANQMAPQNDPAEPNEGPHSAPPIPNERPNDHFEGPLRWPTTTHLHHPLGPERVLTTQSEPRPRARPPEPDHIPARTEAA